MKSAQTSIEQRIQQIENKLNYLCCEHDSLMPILEIHEWGSQTNRWEHNLRNIQKKLYEYNNAFNGLHANPNSHLDEKDKNY